MVTKFEFAGPEATPPAYQISERISPITLYKGNLTVSRGTKSVNGMGEIIFVWSPAPKVQFQIETEDNPFTLLGGFDGILTTELGDKFEVRITSLFIGEDRPPITGELLGECKLGNPENLSRIVFHLPNIPQLLGDFVKTNNSLLRGRVDFTYNEWLITIDPLPRAKEMFTELNATGTSNFTYVGIIKKNDSSLFSADLAEPVLEAFGFFLSFAMGYWCFPLLRVGFNSLDQKTWENWTRNRVSTSQNASSTWFDGTFPKNLNEIFPGFANRLNDKNWKEPFHRAIYWFVENNSGSVSVESSIIVVQAAIELITWVHFVEDEEILSANGFDRLYPSDRIRLALNQLKVSNRIPSDLTSLSSFGNKMGFADAPHTLTEIRNALVHPSKKEKRYEVMNAEAATIFETYSLSLWYLELFVLWLCKFNGEYSYRLHKEKYQGRLTPVPWAKE